MTNLGALSSNATIPASALGDDVLPLGSVIDWYRVTTATAVPAGWAVCDGTAWNDVDNHMGVSKVKLTTGSMPNLVGKFTIGARLTTTAGGVTAADGTASSNGDAYANAPGIGGIGGSNAIKPGHGHGHTITTTVGAKANVTSAENNGATNNITSYNGTGLTVNSETPTTSTNGYHEHGYAGSDITWSSSTSPVNGFARVVSITDYGMTMFGNGNHSHTLAHGHGVTDPSHAHTIYQTNHSHGITGTVGPNTNGDTAVDVRPAHVGLLKIMKVKIV